MITTLLGKLAASVISFVSLLGFGASAPLGTAVPLSPALVDTYLASGISTTDTSMTLANGTMRNGSALSGFMCFVIDNNQPTTEFVCGTASGTSVTGLSRGVDVFNPNATSSALAYAHRRFATVQISDYPTLQFLVRKANGTDGYVSSTPLKYDAEPTFSYGSHQIVTWDKSKDYTDSVAVAGAPNADEVTKGISQLATQNQLAIGSSTGSTGASLVPQSKWFNTTSSATTTVPVTKSNGKLSQGFLDLTEGYTFSGGVTSTGALVQSATSTFSGNNIIGGTTTTISSTNLNITSATTTFTGNVVGATKFGGDGSDGVLNLTSGTTTISAGGTSVLIKNYSSISISATGSLAFSNPAATGTLIILRSRGDVTITCTNAPCIDVSGMGSAGGTNSGFVLGTSNSYGVDGAGCAFDGGGGGGGGSSLNTGGAGGNSGCGGGSAAGTVFDSPKFYTASNENYYYRKVLIMSPGVGGGSGGSSGGQARGGGGGGSGGQIIVLYNFASSTSGTFNMSGGTGGAGGSSGTGGGGGGNGGGALILEVGGKLNFTGTIWSKGNNGTAGGNGAGNAGGAGGAENSNGSVGSNSSPNSNGGGGGGGAGGTKIIMKNTEF